MERILHRPDVLYLIFVRKCYNLKFWLRPLHRNKLLKAITRCITSSDRTTWFIKPYSKCIIHREDGPAAIFLSGAQHWYMCGKLHREDGPAINQNDGTLVWYKNNTLHRDDGPAIIHNDGEQRWFKNGEEVDSF